MPKPYPREFRENVVAVARQGNEGLAQIAKDFGIAESCLRNWLSAADADDGKRGDPKARRLSSCVSSTAAGPRPICPRASTQNDVPAGPSPCRPVRAVARAGDGDLPAAGLLHAGRQTDPVEFEMIRHSATQTVTAA